MIFKIMILDEMTYSECIDREVSSRSFQNLEWAKEKKQARDWDRVSSE